MLSKKHIRLILNYLIWVQFDKEVKMEQKPNFYKNQYLEYALSYHQSPQCIIRTYAEMLKTGSKLYTQDPNDLKHANQLVDFLNLYANNYNQLENINKYFSKLRVQTQEKYAYLIASSHGRLKSFLGIEAKIRKKIIMSKVLKHIMNNLKNMVVARVRFSSSSETIIKIKDLFDSQDIQIATEILLALKMSNDKTDFIRDAVGYRVIVDSVNLSTAENDLIDFVYQFVEDIAEFFDNQGCDIVARKNYIKLPKENNYQSYHIIVKINQIFIEIQVRTSNMHQVAESGSAAHDTIYKNTDLYNFLKLFLYEISRKLDKVSMNQRLGILKEMNLSNRPWIFTTKEEIPTSPSMLKDFSDLDFLKSVFVPTITTK